MIRIRCFQGAWGGVLLAVFIAGWLAMQAVGQVRPKVIDVSPKPKAAAQPSAPAPGKAPQPVTPEKPATGVPSPNGLPLPRAPASATVPNPLIRALRDALQSVKNDVDPAERKKLNPSLDKLDKDLQKADRDLARIREQNARAIKNANRQVRPNHNHAPNVVLVVLDDAGYGDFGSYGQKKIQTPNLDRLAAQGVRFSQFYAGSPIGTAARASLMTGLHTGHLAIRGQGPEDVLKPENCTVAEVLWQGGYTTAGMGLWDLGGPATTGGPNKQGFDFWYGFMDRQEAADPYPDFLWINERKVPIAENANGKEGKYANDIFTEAALTYLDEYTRQPRRPFFLYLPLTLPGTTTKVPSDTPYSDEKWTQEQKNFAATVTRADDTVGRIIDRLKKLNLAGNTAILVTSDGGHSPRQGEDPKFFDSSGGLRGATGDLYEGGIRVPMLMAWPGMMERGIVDSIPRAHWDVMPTLVNLTASIYQPLPIDGVSMLVSLQGVGAKRPVHDYLYWLVKGGKGIEAMRRDNWKAVRPAAMQPLELYNLAEDAGETKNAAAQNPEVVTKIESLIKEAQVPLIRGPAAARQQAGN